VNHRSPRSDSGGPGKVQGFRVSLVNELAHITSSQPPRTLSILDTHVFIASCMPTWQWSVRSAKL